ncbi:glycosyltransferase [Nocardioides KLBMP 9356]|uniref:Glycosyltransferase n=1 Tax=Nocardioides potassii TaxID=2911371 RepID=A0ABS9H6J2_9ACTN|nr:glycosyltransferase [Nocardioides potassii]MCF6376059.1 glycosyltransferase [Nocardioides potassii]
MTRASVLIPIHDKETTLPLAVDTVLRQSVEDVEVLLIGDGVTDGVRRVAGNLVAADRRVRFLDFPKGPFHGERYRHDAIQAADSDAIFYLCDDDLLLPDHVADLLELLEDHDLAQCLNGYLTPAGEVRLFASDLSDPHVAALHLRDDLDYNAISITGTAHTRSAYERVSRWDTTPTGFWPDRWQFRKMLAPGFRAATSARMTALQFPTSSGGRDTWEPQARTDEIVPWHTLVTSPGAQDDIDRRVREGMLRQLIEDREELATLHASLASTREYFTVQLESKETYFGELVAALRAEPAALREELDTLRGHVDRLQEIRAAQEAKIEALRERLRARRG